jgi:hypothetical protein
MEDFMPKVKRSDYFEGGSFLRADDVRPGSKYTIVSFESIKTRIGSRPILRLKETDKPFGLNATNFDTLIERYGDDTDNWKGKKITFNKVKAPNPQLGGKEVDALRIA